MPEHLYRGKGIEERELKEFEARYGSGPGKLRSGKWVPNKGKAIYEGTVGKVKRERASKGRRRR